MFLTRGVSLQRSVLSKEILSLHTSQLNSRVKGDCYRLYTRWSARKPSGVFESSEFSDKSSVLRKSPNKTEDKSNHKKSCSDERQNETEDKSIQKKSSTDNKSRDSKMYPPNKTVCSFNGRDFVTLKDEDPTFSKLMTQVGNRKMRKKNDIIMLEGKRLIQDALQAKLIPKKIFFTDKEFLMDLDLPKEVPIPLFKLSYKVMKLWSKLETPPGIIGFYSIPKAKDIKLNETLPVRVLCDNVREPGNLGSIMRVAAGVGCTELILMKGCTDPWDSKVLRAAAGAHFHVPIKQELSWSEEKEFIYPEDSVFVADSQTERCIRSQLKLPQCLYHSVDYTRYSSILLMIGGETEGVSEEALSLLAKRQGSRLHIPLSNFVDSLNSGCALSVLLFEIKRQLSLCENNFSREENQQVTTHV